LLAIARRQVLALTVMLPAIPHSVERAFA